MLLLHHKQPGGTDPRSSFSLIISAGFKGKPVWIQWNLLFFPQDTWAIRGRLVQGERISMWRRTADISSTAIEMNGIDLENNSTNGGSECLVQRGKRVWEKWSVGGGGGTGNKEKDRKEAKSTSVSGVFVSWNEALIWRHLALKNDQHFSLQLQRFLTE